MSQFKSGFLGNMQLCWHEERGFNHVPYNQEVGLGTYRLMGNHWVFRKKLRRGGRAWKRVGISNPVIKRIKMEALLLGIQL